ncbi:unnamed protein product [Agarophyton chilense]|eukprot:gb/GEZJ01001773.1/.p1 GENE.gb/GEZJ01001773.1/~~gb/GEZJ01001773.1/.p1  ORF type:complete len:257 (-),score=19.40 gb/GEZJ01001773.1/:635-1405(-)
MTHLPSFSDAYGSRAGLMPTTLPAPFPPPRLPRAQHFRSLPPPPPMQMRSLSDTSTKMTELSSCRASTADMEAYNVAAHMGERYIPILPRTSSHAHFNKRCETCSASHDGSFGAGRFCSSRCARTVGGLAHRKKRLMERECKQRHAVQKRLTNKRLRTAVGSYKTPESTVDERVGINHGMPMRMSAPSGAMTSIMPPVTRVRQYMQPVITDSASERSHRINGPIVSTAGATTAESTLSYRSPKSVMTITSLLNPRE